MAIKRPTAKRIPPNAALFRRNGYQVARCRFAVKRRTAAHMLRANALFGRKCPKSGQISLCHKVTYGQAYSAEYGLIWSNMARKVARCRFAINRPTAKCIPRDMGVFGRKWPHSGQPFWQKATYGQAYSTAYGVIWPKWPQSGQRSICHKTTCGGEYSPGYCGASARKVARSRVAIKRPTA